MTEIFSRIESHCKKSKTKIMKTYLRAFLTCGMILSSVFFFSACDDDDEPQPQLTGNSKTYELSSVSDPGVSGNVTFAERDDDQVLITIQ